VSPRPAARFLAWLALTLGAVAQVGCRGVGREPGPIGPITPQLSVVVVAAPELERWARAAVALFEAQPRKTSSGQVVRPYLVLLDDAEAAARIGRGELQADLWIPSATPATGWLADPVPVKPLGKPADPVKLADCAPVVTSPLVVALTRKRAESLGLIKDGLSWQSLGALARASARGQKPGESPGFLVAYPHPLQSAVGLLAVSAMRRLELPAVEPSPPAASSNVLEEVERVIGRRAAHARALVDALALPQSPLSVVLAPQHLVTEHNRERASAAAAVAAGAAPPAGSAAQRPATPPGPATGTGGPASAGAGGAAATTPPLPSVPPAGELVALLPSDGTHLVDYPACLVHGSWSAPERKQAASWVKDHLASSTVQETARVSFGLRPTRLPGATPPGAPAEPLLLAAPGADDATASRAAFLRTRRPALVMLLVDRSPSMAGGRLQAVREALPALAEALGPGDRVAVWPFDEKLDQSRQPEPAHPEAADGGVAEAPAGTAAAPAMAPATETISAALKKSLDGVQAGRGCALYDAIAEGLKTSSSTAQAGAARAAVVVITDGRDEGSRTALAELLTLASQAQMRGVTLHAVALTRQVDRRRLAQLARRGGGELVNVERGELPSALRHVGRTL
jgi:Mg-chelatase subunit ChlD